MRSISDEPVLIPCGHRIEPKFGAVLAVPYPIIIRVAFLPAAAVLSMRSINRVLEARARS